jgi:hypothetical protein
VFRLVGRRAVLAHAAAALAAVPMLARGPLAAAKANTKTSGKTEPKANAAAQGKAKSKPASQKAFRLVTGCGVQGGCSCKACQKHAANKFFASRADVVRAHQGCDCKIETSSLPRDIWVALFGLPERPTTTAVDKRDPRVAEILSHLPQHSGHGSHHHK